MVRRQHPKIARRSPGALSRDRGAEDLGAEEAALGALDDLLVDRDGRVVHQHGAGFVVDFGVDARVAD